MAQPARGVHHRAHRESRERSSSRLAEAWALFPGEVAYVWHAGIYATTVAESLLQSGLTLRSQIIWAKPRLVLSRGHYHWQHEPCWLRYVMAGRGTGRAHETRPPSGLSMVLQRTRTPVTPRRSRSSACAGHHHRRRAREPPLLCRGALTRVRRCGCAALAGVHGQTGSTQHWCDLLRSRRRTKRPS